MDPGYVKADSRDLSYVNHIMVARVFFESGLHVSANILAVNNQR